MVKNKPSLLCRQHGGRMGNERGETVTSPLCSLAFLDLRFLTDSVTVSKGVACRLRGLELAHQKTSLLAVLDLTMHIIQ